jgi:uncharacterized protein
MTIIYMEKRTQTMNDFFKNITNTYIFIDTSAWFSLLHKKDNHHNKITSVYNYLLKNHNTLITSNFVIGETYTLMRYKLDKKSNKPLEFIELVRNSQRIEEVFINKNIEERAQDILKKYIDHKFSYVDATSFALMNTMNINYALSLDNHFITAGFIIL